MANEALEWANAHKECWGMITLPKSKQPRPARVDNLIGNDVYMTIISANGNTRALTLPFEQAKGSDWYLPDTRFVNGKALCYFYKTQPTRQYRKALTWDPGAITKFNANYNVDISEEMMRAEILRNWPKEFPTFKQALDDVSEGRCVSRAFTKRWALATFINIDDIILYHQTIAVGRVGGGQIKLLQSMMVWKEHLNRITGMEVVPYAAR